MSIQRIVTLVLSQNQPTISSRMHTITSKEIKNRIGPKFEFCGLPEEAISQKILHLYILQC